MFDFDPSMNHDPEYAAIVNKIIEQEVVPASFVYKGHDCRVLRSNLGHLCGYVRLNEDHPFYEKHYNEQCSVPLSIINKEVTLRDTSIMSIVSDVLSGNLDDGELSIASILSVHGGITFSGEPSNGEGGWWYGFDCAHYGDYVPLSYIGGSYKELTFVENQCKQLVEELIEVYNWPKMI